MQVLTIHPINEDLRFLRKFVRKFKFRGDGVVITRKLSNNVASHYEAIRRIKGLNESSVVCFLNHGATRAIHGSEFRSKYGSHPHQFSFQEELGYFIDSNNIDVLSGKKVFCLSCNSESLGNLAINSGAIVFIGFSTIDFDIRDELIGKQKPRSYVVSKSKYSLRNAVYQTLANAMENNLTFHEIHSLLKVNLNKEMDELIITNKKKPGYKYYKSAADCLLTIRQGIRLFGNGNVNFLD